MFDELFSEITASLDELRHGTPVRIIKVAKPFCTPARDIVTGALQPYGVRIYGYQEYTKQMGLGAALKQLRLSPASFDAGGRGVPDALPLATIAEVKVAEQAAAWAEYLLLRTQKLYRVGGYVNRRNEQWAAQHGGQMPPAWADGKPWIETGCKAGMDAWGSLRKAAKKCKYQVRRAIMGNSVRTLFDFPPLAYVLRSLKSALEPYFLPLRQFLLHAIITQTRIFMF